MAISRSTVVSLVSHRAGMNKSGLFGGTILGVMFGSSVYNKSWAGVLSPSRVQPAATDLHYPVITVPPHRRQTGPKARNRD